MRLEINAEKCTECGRCAASCSLEKTGRINPLFSRISVVRRWPEVPELNVCRFEDCIGQPCIDSCPFDAIQVTNGTVLINNDACRGCRKCIPVCPYSAIRMDENNRLAFKCDLCGGTPACVPECVTGALGFGEVR